MDRRHPEQCARRWLGWRQGAAVSPLRLHAPPSAPTSTSRDPAGCRAPWDCASDDASPVCYVADKGPRGARFVDMEGSLMPETVQDYLGSHSLLTIATAS